MAVTSVFQKKICSCYRIFVYFTGTFVCIYYIDLHDIIKLELFDQIHIYKIEAGQVEL